MRLKRYQLALAVKEQEYMRRLAEYMRESPFGEQWQVTAFTNAEACQKYVEQGYKIDLLAIQPDLLLEMKDELPKVPIVALVMKLGQSRQELELLQFQPLPLLLQHLTEIHARSIRHHVHIAASAEGRVGVKVISVYSASGGIGKTALALHLVHAAGTQQHRTFYLNLEKWNTAEVWLGETAADGASSEGLSELLYGLKSQPELSRRWIAEHRKRHPLLKGDYLAPCTNLEDRMTLEPEDAASLLKAISESGLYDLIVIDLDVGLEELHMGLFELSDQVLWAVNDHPSVRSKQMLALRYGEQKWGERFEAQLRKFKWVRSRISEQQGASAELSRLDVIPVVLPEVAEWHGAAGVTLLSSPLFRAAVDQLFRHLLQEGGSLVAKR